MTTIADRLAEALKYAMDWNWLVDDARPSWTADFCEGVLAAYDASKGRDEPVSPAPQGPSAECWRMAIAESRRMTFNKNLDWIEQRANELAGSGK